MSWSGVLWSCVAGVLAWTPNVAAHTLEEFDQLVLGPEGAAGTLVLRYRNSGDGLLYAHGGDSDWRLMCGAAIPTLLRAGGPLSITASGGVLLGASDGLWQDDGSGCTWTPDPTLRGLRVADLVRDAVDPDYSLVAVSRPNAEPGSRLLRRDPTGEAAELPIEQGLVIQSLRASRLRDAQRIYLSGFSAAMAATVVGFSDDLGQHWELYPQRGLVGSIRLQGVDPSNPDRVVISVTSANDTDEIWVSADRGASFALYLQLQKLGGLAAALDGRFWFGDAGGATSTISEPALWYAAGLDVPPTQIDSYPVRCLTHDDVTDTLYVCQPWSFGKLSAANGGFQELLSLTKLSRFVECPDADVSALCERQLCDGYCRDFSDAPVCDSYQQVGCGTAGSTAHGAVAGDDAGALGSDAAIGSDADSPDIVPNGSSSSACAMRGAKTGGTKHSESGLAVLVATLGLLGVRSRRRRAQGSRTSI